MILLGVFANYIGYRFRKITQEFPFQELQCSLTYVIKMVSLLDVRTLKNHSMYQTHSFLKLLVTKYIFTLIG